VTKATAKPKVVARRAGSCGAWETEVRRSWWSIGRRTTIGPFPKGKLDDGESELQARSARWKKRSASEASSGETSGRSRTSTGRDVPRSSGTGR
jgi:hypothetical protein